MKVECKFIIMVSRVLLGYHSNTCWIDSLLFRIQAACVAVVVLLLFLSLLPKQCPSQERWVSDGESAVGPDRMKVSDLRVEMRQPSAIRLSVASLDPRRVAERYSVVPRGNS
jgi:hypothetical protein